LELSLIHHHNPCFGTFFVETERNCQNAAHHFFGRLRKYMATIAAADLLHKSAAVSLIPARQWRKSATFSTRQIHRPHPPHKCRLGSVPQASRRQHRHKIRHSAALLVLAARHFGDKIAIRPKDCIYLLANS
jgi:hypothetical protein